MAHTYAYLFFEGNCREAMEYYQSIFGGELSIQTVNESQVKERVGEKYHNDVIHAHLESGDLNLMASDMMGMEDITKGNDVALTFIGENREELEAVFPKLAKGGHVHVELKEEFFGTYGDLRDKYGFRWLLQSPKKEI